MSFLYTWIIIGVIFLIIEVFTVSLYGLSLALASAVVALYVWYTGESDFSIMQSVIFVVLSAIFAYFIPSYFMNRVKTKSQGMDVYIGKTGKIIETAQGLKVELDGVPYRILDEDKKTFTSGDPVRVIAHTGGVFDVEKK